MGVDFFFHPDTMYMQGTFFPGPAQRYAVYTVDGNTITVRSVPNFDCTTDVDTFTFTIVADTLDFIPLSASCESQIATLAQYMFIRSAPVSVNDINPLHFSLYPNPAGETLHLNMGTETTDDCKLYMYDPIGRLVKTYPVSYRQHTIDIADLPNGVCVVEVINGSRSARQKITIQH